MIKDEYIQLLACPICKSDLRLEDNFLICRNCKEKYEIIEDIPILLPKSLSTDLKITQSTWDRIYSADTETLKIDLNNEIELRDSYTHIKKYSSTSDGYFLEVGCGVAKNSFLLKKDGRKIVGIDISLQALLRARELFNNNGLEGFFVCGSILNMPFKDNQFCFMYAGGVVEHFKDTLSAVKELHRCLRKNGIISITVPYISGATPYIMLRGNIPNIYILKEFLEFLHIKLLRGKYMKFGYEQSFSRREISEIFNDSGFTNIEIGLFETYYPLVLFRYSFIKKMLTKLAKHKLFWPMIFVNGRK